MNLPEITTLIPGRLKRRGTSEREEMELWLVAEIVMLHEQLIELQRAKAESQNQILVLREAYEYKDDNG